MKRTALLLLMVFMGCTIFAKNPIYVSAGLGAGMTTARSYDFINNDQVNPVGFGKGMDIKVRGGMFLNDYLAVEFGIVYHKGFNTKITDNNSFGIPFSYGEAAGSDQTIYKYSGSMLQLVPGIMFMPMPSEKLRPYARIGLILGVLPSIKYKAEGTGTGNEIDAKFKYSGGMAIGGTTALGCDFSLSDLLSVYGELYYDALTYAPKKGKFQELSVAGTDQLPLMDTYQKEYEYVKDIPSGYNPSDTPGSASKILKNTYPFSGFGLNVGVRIKL